MFYLPASPICSIKVLLKALCLDVKWKNEGPVAWLCLVLKFTIAGFGMLVLKAFTFT